MYACRVTHADPRASDLDPLRDEVRSLVAERDWAQFHAPKNLVMALSVEMAELLEPFQWLSPEQSDNLDPAQRLAVEEEVGDVTIYLLMLCERLGIDPIRAAHDKLKKVRAKYPAAAARGEV